MVISKQAHGNCGVKTKYAWMQMSEECKRLEKTPLEMTYERTKKEKRRKEITETTKEITKGITETTKKNNGDNDVHPDNEH